jgi:tetratricopeptide (TPR) repeat protein
MTQEPWWSVYGTFDPGEDNLPHTGQVLMHYARRSGLKAAHLAHMVGQLGWEIKERRMEDYLSKKNISDPQQISRRKLLIQLLGIPPILMGVADIMNGNEEHEPANIPSPLGQDAMLRYESALGTYWDSFYSSSVQKHWLMINRWCDHLEELAHTAHGSEQQQVLTLLCRFKQLAAVAARDRTDFGTAMLYHNTSVRLASELQNAELSAASLVRRAKTLVRTNKIDSAIADVSTAARYATSSRDNLRGYVFQATAEIISQLPPSLDTLMQYQRYMDAAGRIVHKGALEDDGSYMLLTPAGYHQDQARGFLRLGKYERAIREIEIGEKAHKPDMTRWQAEFSILKTQAYARLGEIEWACKQLEEALRLVRVTGSKGKRRKLQLIYASIAKEHPNQASLRHLDALLRD